MSEAEIGTPAALANTLTARTECSAEVLQLFLAVEALEEEPSQPLSAAWPESSPLAGWPEDLLEKYGQLSLPSLYEFLLSQEKLGVEIRKQNKELRLLLDSQKSMQQGIGAVSATLEAFCGEFQSKSVGSEPVGRAGGKSAFDPQKYESALMQMMDCMLNLLEAQRLSSGQILKAIPERFCSRIRHAQPVKNQVAAICRGVSAGVETIRCKLFSLLADLAVEVIAPQVDDVFSPHHHRAIERIKGGTSTHIAKVVRLGFAKDGVVLRPAEVVIYKGNA